MVANDLVVDLLVTGGHALIGLPSTPPNNLIHGPSIGCRLAGGRVIAVRPGARTLRGLLRRLLCRLPRGLWLANYLLRMLYLLLLRG